MQEERRQDCDGGRQRNDQEPAELTVRQHRYGCALPLGAAGLDDPVDPM
jgi:hypothetical protein